MKILIADKFQDQYLDHIRSLGHDVTLKPIVTAEELPNEVKGYHALIVRGKKVTAKTIESADALKIIVRAGAGTNTIDIAKAKERGVYVCNTPGKNGIAVAELVMGLLISIDRKIPENVFDLKNKIWNKKKYSESRGLFGRSLGIVGLGAIGYTVAKRANAFGLQVYAVDPNVDRCEKEPWITFCDDIYELAKRCDIFTFHVPSMTETKGMINKKFLDCVKDGSIIINTSRGDLIVDPDLICAMDKKNIFVGLDVYNNEPEKSSCEFVTPLTMHRNVYGTHHIGASTEQAQNAIAEEVIEIIKDFDMGRIRHCVNIKCQ